MRIVALCSCVFSIVYDQVILTSNTSLVVFFPLKIYHSGYLAGFSLVHRLEVPFSSIGIGHF